MENDILVFISGLIPFSFIPQSELKPYVNEFDVRSYPKDTVVFVQGQSIVSHLYIVKEGAAERYFETDSEKILRGILGEGDIYGGISMLLHNNIAVRSLKVTEETRFLRLPRNTFLHICNTYPAFSEYFTDTFGKRMLNRSYAEIITKNYPRKSDDDSTLLFNQPITDIYNPNVVSCTADISIRDAATIMTAKKCSSIFIKDASGRFVGLATDHDLRTRVVAAGYNTDQPVADIMSAPLRTVPRKALVFETLMEMMRHDIKHIGVTDNRDDLEGVVTDTDLINAQGGSPLFLAREISKAKDIDTLAREYRRLPPIIQNQIRIGAKARNVTRLISGIADTILEKLIRQALEEIGPPPARFVFLVMGSEGRREQTLKTDQDNAILYEDVPTSNAKTVGAYFLSLGEKVCGMLDTVGYAYCKGNVMAQNPQWCQPLSVWETYFKKWVHSAEAAALLQAGIFFDFRGGYGDFTLVDQLRARLFDILKNWPGFFRHMAENALQIRLPIGFFRNFVVESKGAHRNTFDIKNAMQPIVNYARLYALQNRLPETNTLERLSQLKSLGKLSDNGYEELDQAYGFMMQLRIVGQIQNAMTPAAKPNNYINPDKLSRLEQTMLKEVFKRLEKYQSQLSFDFLGGQ